MSDIREMIRNEYSQDVPNGMQMLEPEELDAVIIGICPLGEDPEKLRVVYSRDRLIHIWRDMYLKEGIEKEDAWQQAVDMVDNDMPKAITYWAARGMNFPLVVTSTGFESDPPNDLEE